MIAMGINPLTNFWFRR